MNLPNASSRYYTLKENKEDRQDIIGLQNIAIGEGGKFFAGAMTLEDRLEVFEGRNHAG